MPDVNAIPVTKMPVMKTRFLTKLPEPAQRMSAEQWKRYEKEAAARRKKSDTDGTLRRMRLLVENSRLL